MALRLKGNAPEPGEVDRRYYMIDVQEGKRRERISTGTRDRKLAERREQAVLDALRRDITVPRADLLALVRGAQRASGLIAAAAQGPTFGEMGASCVENVWKGTSGWRTTRSNYEMVLDFIGPDTKIANIDRARLEAMVKHFKDAGNGPGTINRKLSIVSAVLIHAIDDKKVPLLMPRFPRQAGERRRQFVFNEGEFELMLAAVAAQDDRVAKTKHARPIQYDAHLYVRYFAFMFETGMRPAEAYKLPWSNIDFNRGVIKVKHAEHLGLRTKTGKSREVPMTARCRALLLEVKGQKQVGPFTNLNYDRGTSHWGAAKKALGITDKDCVPYATRHSLATRLIEATGDLNQAKEWLGHSTIRLTADTYSHVSSKYMSLGANALDSRRSEYEEAEITRDSVIHAPVLYAGSTLKKPN